MRFVRIGLGVAVLGMFGTVWLLAGLYLYLSPSLPDVETLRDVRLQTPMRVYTREGELIGQFGEQKRNPLSYDRIPPDFVHALLAAEDDAFFRHGGIDFMGLLRAVSELVLTGEKGSGGSTLTMQVARNYFLSLERTFSRKFREILLAIEIERALSKEEIFELYFNRVFLGHRAYGFQAASQVYYGVGIDQLDLAQLAMLAGIPKAPSRNNPISGPEAGRERRNWILQRMYRLGYIDSERYESARMEPVTAAHHGSRLSFRADYVAEMARQEMVDRFGMAAYDDGYRVYTTVRADLQQVAQQAVIDGLLTYDSRHGFRGPERQLPPREEESDEALHERWLAALRDTPVIAGLHPAVVSGVGEDTLTLFVTNGTKDIAAAANGESPGEGGEPGAEITLKWENGLRQARPYLDENYRGRAPDEAADIATVGDLLRVRYQEGEWHLSQVPAAQAALISLNPDNGAILSVVGGMGFELSKFNRATQARRQPGSNFKPFLYSAALANGFTAASIINDAPVVFQDASLEGLWRPENDAGKFYGPTRLRWALTKSRNLVSIRLLRELGVEKVIDYAGRFGFDTRDFARDLSLALGTHAMSPLAVARGYAILANGGYRVEPFLIQRIEDLKGELLEEARPLTVCRECDNDTSEKPEPAHELRMEEILARDEGPKEALPRAPRIMDERVNFIINSILRDVVTRGTAQRALALKRSDIAGKTGTTNGPMDAWFSGFNLEVVTTTWVGFDNYTPLGRREYGGTAALPIWIDYMREALKDSPERQRPVPPGVSAVRIDPATGLLARPGQADAIFEYFREENVPTEVAHDENGSNGNGSAEDPYSDIY